MGNNQLHKIIKINSIAILLLLVFLSNKIIAQKIKIPTWIDSIYSSKSSNIDSIKKAIPKSKKDVPNLSLFKKYLENTLAKDSSLNTKLKTMYLVNYVFSKTDTNMMSALTYEDKLFYFILWKKIYVAIPYSDFINKYKNDYNFRSSTMPSDFIPIEIFTDKRTVEFYKNNVPIKPTLIGEYQFPFYRNYNISAYNDLILEYILKSVDSVAFKNDGSFGLGFMETIQGAGIYTLAYFNDERVIPYLEKMVEQTGMTFRYYLIPFLRPYEGNIGEKIQLSLWRAILQRKNVLEQEQVYSFEIGNYYYKYIPLHELVSLTRDSFKQFFPEQQKPLSSLKSAQDSLQFLRGLVEKRLQELEKK